jgi:hypothetical protein
LAGREVTEMSDDAKRQSNVAAKRAAQLFQRQQDSDRRISEEEKRHNDMLAKTARLREQRLARDATQAGQRKIRSRKGALRK